MIDVNNLAKTYCFRKETGCLHVHIWVITAFMYSIHPAELEAVKFEPLSGPVTFKQNAILMLLCGAITPFRIRYGCRRRHPVVLSLSHDTLSVSVVGQE
jgi:hypothetical protein